MSVKKETLRSLSIEEVGNGHEKDRMIETFKKAGFIEGTCKCGRWFMRHRDDESGFCPVCSSTIPPHLNN
jgi:hypothetical protein